MEIVYCNRFLDLKIYIYIVDLFIYLFFHLFYESTLPWNCYDYNYEDSACEH